MVDSDTGITRFTMLAHGMFHTYELSIPIFVIVWLDVFDTTAAVLGLIIGAGYALIGIGAVPSGIIADRIGSRSLILGSVIGMSGGFLLVAFAQNLYMLAAALLLWGLAASLYHPAGLSLISRFAQARGKVFAYHGVGGNIGTVMGPLVTVILLTFLEWQLVIGILALPVIPIVLLGSRISFDESTDATDGSTEAAESYGVAFIRDTRRLFTVGFSIALVVVMLYGTYYRGLLTFLPEVIGTLPGLAAIEIAGRRTPPAQYIYTGLLVVGIAGQYVGGRVTERVDPTLALAGALTALGVLALLFLPVAALGTLPFLLLCGLLGFFLYASAPIYQVTIADHAQEDVHGLSYGFTYFGMFGVGAGGAALAGAVLTYANATVLLQTLAALAVVAVVLALTLRRRDATVAAHAVRSD
ncbi:MAG: MFS transporter [Haloquadratum sp.]|nr:MFS transporter [Haloferacaceae archaeon]MDR9445009.1 MFS transporter [Haloquadratum sp.]